MKLDTITIGGLDEVEIHLEKKMYDISVKLSRKGKTWEAPEKIGMKLPAAVPSVLRKLLKKHEGTIIAALS